MNLLTFKNRFEDTTPDSNTISEVNGYTKALLDITDYLKKVTEWNPQKRMIDAVEILDTITETNNALTKIGRQTEGELILMKNNLPPNQ